MSLADLNKEAPSEADLLARISEARNPTEPLEPTEDPSPVDVSEEMPEEAIAESEEEAETLEAEELSETTEELEDLIYEIDGEQFTLSEIQSWKKGHMQEADYTQKSQANAELRKTYEAELTALQERGDGLKDLIATLESSINADISDEHLAQLLEDDDTGEYLRLTEKKKARLSKLDLAKAERSKLKKEKLTAKQQKGNQELIEMNPTWVENGQPTQAYTDDQSLLGQYAKDNGFTQDEINSALTSGRIMQAMINSARLQSKVSKAPEIVKKVRKAPTIVKGKQRQISSLDKQLQDAKAKAKRTGRMEDAAIVRKLTRQRASTGQ